jgi:hypothetical protein
MRPWAEIFEELVDDAIAHRAAARRRQTGMKRRPNRVGLKPGDETPLWNAFAGVVRVRLQRYGDKAKLGRFIDVPRQRIHQYFVDGTQMPDAERLLLLLVWLHSQDRAAPVKKKPVSLGK